MRRLLILLLGCCSLGHADTVIKTHSVLTDTGAPPNLQSRSEHREVRYQRGAMRRSDTMGDGTTVVLSTIVNCDARGGFLIDFNAKEYQNYKVVKFASIKDLDSYREKNVRDVVQIESKTVDTGERKTFFGRSAKHLITTTVRSADEKSAGGEETIDGWHIEHEASDEKCAPDFVRTEPFYVIGTAL